MKIYSFAIYLIAPNVFLFKLIPSSSSELNRGVSKIMPLASQHWIVKLSDCVIGDWRLEVVGGWVITGERSADNRCC